MNKFLITVITIFASVGLFANNETPVAKATILVLIHSNEGGTYELAKEIEQGIKSEGQNAVIKLVQKSSVSKLKNLDVATPDELVNYDGIAIGSPVYFGGMSTEMSAFWAKTIGLWQNHALEGKPVTVFMSAGSGAGRELAIQSIWNMVAVHGMTIVTNGIRGVETLDQSIPQGNTVLGTTSLASNKAAVRPSEGERKMARLQGAQLAKVSSRLSITDQAVAVSSIAAKESRVEDKLKELGIVLPATPAPAGNYKPFVRSGNLVYINQVALDKGQILFPGKIGVDLTEDEAQLATKQTMLNVLAVLKDAVDGDLNRVVQCVQLSGYFNTTTSFSRHAAIMNTASDLVVSILGDKGKHARGTFGAPSLPVNSAVEIQAIFEVQ